MDLSHPPLGEARMDQMDGEGRNSVLNDFRRKNPASDGYPVNTIGPAAGASIIRQTPGLVRSHEPQQPRKSSSGAPAQPNRSTFGPPSKEAEAFGPPSPAGSDDSGLDNETQAYFDRSLDADLTNPANMATIASYGLSEHPTYDDERGQHFVGQLMALDEERNARAYADMSAAEQYALQSRLHAEKQSDIVHARSRPSSVYGGLSTAPPPEPVVQRDGSGRQPRNHFSSETEEASLGSPFRHRSNSGSQVQSARLPPPRAPASVAHSRPQSAQPHQPHRSKPPVSGSLRDRGRKTSSTSLNVSQDGSLGLTKDELLERLAEALRKERAKNKSYMKELIEAENEIDALSRLLDKTRVEASHTNAKHATTISALRRELGQTRQTLDQALEVRADDAERFLDLIDAAPNQGSNFGSGMVTGASEEEEDEINGHEMHVPASKTEAILAFAADQPGGTNARARQRSNDRRRRLDNALSTIASSSLGPTKSSAPQLPWPKQQLKDNQPSSITLEPPQSSNAFASLFRKRSNSASRADVPDITTTGPYGGKGTRLRSHRRASDTDVRNSNKPPASASSSYKQPNSAGLLPPMVARAHEGGTYGRSASSDVPRHDFGVMDDANLPSSIDLPPAAAKRKERKTSFTKILAKAFPVRDPPPSRRSNSATLVAGLTSSTELALILPAQGFGNSGNWPSKDVDGNGSTRCGHALSHPFGFCFVCLEVWPSDLVA